MGAAISAAYLVSILVFVELALGELAWMPQPSSIDVSILVFVELALGGQW